MSNKELETPMMKQYLKIKSEYPNGLLFYRMGDFYELFFEDAKIASKLLDITLTKRNKNSNIYMAGVPYHSVDSYISKLIKVGYTVLICEQVGEVTKGSVVERKVTNIITPGTAVEENIVNSEDDTVLVSLIEENNRIGMSSLNISTGEIFVYELNSIEELIQEVKIIAPNEIICCDKNKLYFENIFNNLKINFISEELYSHVNKKLSFVEYKFNKLSMKCSYSIINYLDNLLLTELPHLKQVKIFNKDKYIILDDITIKNLELLKNIKGEDRGSLLNIIDTTVTCMGTRKLKNWIKNPLKKKEDILIRQNIVQSIYEKNIFEHIDSLLINIPDIQRILSRISLHKSRPKDLARLRDYIKILPEIKKVLLFLNPEQTIFDVDEHVEVLALLEKSIIEEPPLFLREGGVIKKGYNKELDELRKISTDTSDFLLEYEEELINNYNISSLRIKSNKISGFYIEIPKGQAKNIPKELIRTQTIKNSERYTTEKLKTFEDKIITSKSKYLKMEKMIYDSIEKKLSEVINELMNTTENVISLDILNSFAKNINLFNLKKPVFGNTMFIKKGRHIVVENNNDIRFVSNDLVFENYDLMVLTGPNMGGKSTYMRQNAIIMIMAGMGSYVPCEYCEMPYIDRIFTRIGASDDLSNGDSTFMIEMKETANILNNATKYSFVLMDEVGRGTSTYDGISLAWSLIVELSQKIKCKTIFSTHYFELTELEESFDNIINKHFSAEENDSELIFSHTIKEGFIDKSYGLEVAKLAGVKLQVVERANKKLLLLKEKNKNIDVCLKKSNNVVKEIMDINLNKLTPIEALNIIFEIQEKLKED